MMNQFIQVLNGEALSSPPAWLMRQAGRYLPEYRLLRQQAPDFLSFCYTPDLTVEATLQPLRRYNFSAAILFSDILVVPHALGQQVAFEEKRGPVLKPFQSFKDLLPFEEDCFLKNLAPIFETLRRLKATIPSSTALIGFAGAPWTLFAYMVEGQGSRTFGQALQFWLSQPTLARALMDRLIEALCLFLKAQIQAGAQVIQLFDSWAGVVPFPLLTDLIYDPTRRLMDFLALEAPQTPVICFPKGLGDKLPTYVQRTQARALSLDAQVDIEALLPQLPLSFPLQGALDPHILVVGGSLLRQEVHRLRRLFERRPYIFNLGHGILPATPPAHVDHLFQYLQEDLS